MQLECERRTYVGAEAAPSGDQRQWGFGYGVGWGESGWGLHQYSGWGIGVTNYTDELDDSNSLPQQQTDMMDVATKPHVTTLFHYLPLRRPREAAKYCDHRVCLSVCLFVCPLAHLKNHMSKLHDIFCAC